MTAEEVKAGQVLLVDKPLEWTSFQAVAKIRFALQKEFALKKLKVGHAGTLDPPPQAYLLFVWVKRPKRFPLTWGSTTIYSGDYFWWYHSFL